MKGNKPGLRGSKHMMLVLVLLLVRALAMRGGDECKDWK